MCKCGTCGELQILDPATLGVSLYFSVAEGEEDIHWGLPPEYDEQLREGISQLRHDIEKIFGPTAQMNAKGGQLLYLVLADDGEGGKIPILLLDEPMRSYLKAGD